MTAKVTIVALALVAGLVCVEAAGGIKGRQQNEGFRAQSVKGPAAQKPIVQQQYLPPPPPPQPLAPPPALPTPTFSQQAIKGPSFTPVRAPPAPAPIQQRVQVQEQVQEQEPEPVQQQQQQEEIDPNAAAQEGNAAFLAPARAGAASEEEANPRPEPYAFQYAFNSGDQATSGSSQREETQDANGRVTGFYTLKGEDGRDRRVDYVADASGFRATISTNELGTANKDSADATWSAQEPSEAQLRAAESATQEAQQRALLSPAQQQHHHSGEQHQQQQQQQSYLALGSSGSSSFERASASASGLSPQKFSAPRRQAGPAAQSRANSQQQFQQLQEPFEQIRQTELNSRARKSRRHAPFYLFSN